ncbi:hypothetical protein OJAV_G00116970 [Oryzias javanicus]|uniref:omega-amidase n=1 Tax=Oryzias javanicus TaxID=123683 RepID=A0A437CS92_ORYJA|nr:hypothetical protein OJAV_G00116970 [Oryzias javanicus]
MLSEAAQENQVYLVGGSIPEKDGGKLYNTCAVFGPDGEMILKHRKIHLFDINVPGKICFQESETLSPGNSLSTFDTPFCKVGVGICYDMRFAELAQIYSRKGCQLLVYPGAFNMTTGPAHWELLQREGLLITSSVVNPWGEVISKAGAEETVIYADIDLQYVEATSCSRSHHSSAAGRPLRCDVCAGGIRLSEAAQTSPGFKSRWI